MHIRSSLFHGISRASQSGQTILLMILIIGTILLGSTVVAGVLVIYQLRQTVDFANSTKAIFAADSGIEWALFDFFCQDTGRCSGFVPPPDLSRADAEVNVRCYDAGGAEVFCEDPAMNLVRSLGTARNSARSFEVCFDNQCGP